ncbi:MAG: PQQ-binding-like beta-propeller repeat protein [Myxococcales bacterium]|nr:PQQ-binding-like beta-propeller repeat protein [Myxococcales bacterium]
MGHSRRLLGCFVATLALAGLPSAARAQIGPDNVDALSLLWDFPLTGGVTANVTLANGLAYVSSWDGKVYALDPETGAEQWSYDTGSGGVLGVQSTVLALPDGSVVFGDSNASVHRLDGATGSVIWSESVAVNLEVDHIWTALATANGRLIVGVADHGFDVPCTRGRLVALDPNDGSELWSLETVPDKICTNDTAVECSGDTTCTDLGTDPNATCVEALGAGVTATVAVDPTGEFLYMNTVGCITFPSVGDSDSMLKITAATGSVVWRTRLSPPEQFGFCTLDFSIDCGTDLDCAPSNGTCTTKPIYHDVGFLNGPTQVEIDDGLGGTKTVLISGSKDGTLYALNETDGSIAWTNAVVPVPVSPGSAGFGLFNGPVSIGDGRVYAALYQLCPLSNLPCFSADPNLPPDDHLQAFDVETGATLWTAESDASWSGIGLANDVVYAGSNVTDPAEFFAYDSETGTRLAAFSLPATTVSRATVDGESLYIGYGIFGGVGGVRAFGFPQNKDQQKCINALNKNFAKVAKTQGKDNCSCIKDFAKAKLTGTIESCLTSDLKGKVAKAKSKTESDESKNCAASTPDFGATSSSVVNATAMQKELDLIHDVFGSDLDAAIFTEEAEKDLSKCQQQAAKQVKKCQDTKLKEFNKCKKSGLKDESIQSASDLAVCMGLDLKGKIAKDCVTKIDDKLSKKCGSAVIATVFPGECSGSSNLAELGDCLDRLVECRVCLGLNAADALSRDCDEFDDGLTNGSCPP